MDLAAIESTKALEMQHIHLIDTSVASDNVGDEIIVSEARAHIDTIFRDAYVSTSSGHDGLGHYSRSLVATADLVFLLGTNALSAKYQMRGNFIWNVARKDIPILAGKVILFGVGANRDFDQISWRQARLLRRLLSSSHKHAVRDQTGYRLLESCGIAAINTSCPTLWRYASNLTVLPTRPSTNVCFTLTKHKRHNSDISMIDALRRVYKTVFFWPQQPRDLDYLKEITSTDDITIVAPNLAAYDDLLGNQSMDVVGTRLHGCIRGLKHGQRVLVVAIDNRARDIGRETNLPTISREHVAEHLEQVLLADSAITLNVSAQPIRDYLSQFSPHLSAGYDEAPFLGP